ncbi:6-phosphogluconolactonase [uncultured Jatrophihabitans sp.]|uniref:6-phosphogluconolactonase n=1 Tax=uncultured Jatrophihabitans sp. TaxID=1610747 RepID=UPI0035CCA4CF
MSGEPEVEVSASADTLATSTAQRAVRTLGEALAARDTAHLVLTGGGVLEQVMTAIASSSDDLDWSRVHVWWGDERYVPHDSDDRNDLPAFAKLLDHVDVDVANVHRMPASDAGFDDAEAAAQAYAAELAQHSGGGVTPAFDVALIGIGPDGHCCSLFPHHPVLDVTGTPTAAVHDSPKPPPDRLTLTFTGLGAVREIWFVASGDGKAEAAAQALSGSASTADVPSSRPRGTERTLWLLDRDAASKLQG